MLVKVDFLIMCRKGKVREGVPDGDGEFQNHMKDDQRREKEIPAKSE
jgi:hypothetical protein